MYVFIYLSSKLGIFELCHLCINLLKFLIVFHFFHFQNHFLGYVSFICLFVYLFIYLCKYLIMYFLGNVSFISLFTVPAQQNTSRNIS